MQRIALFGIVLFAIAKSWLVWILLLLWGALGFYDLTLSQLVPEAHARDFPKAFALLERLVIWMPWWGYVMGGLVIFIIGVLEYVYKTHKRLSLAVATPLSAAPTLTLAQAAPSAQALVSCPNPLIEPDGARNDLRRGFESVHNQRNSSDRELALTLLADLRGKGIEIRNAVGSAHGDGEAEWTKATKWWTEETSSAIGKINHTDSRLFDYLDTVEPPRVHIGQLLANPSPAVALAYNMLDKRLQWLFDLIKKYQETP